MAYNGFIMALPSEPSAPSSKEKKEVLSRLKPEEHPVIERSTVPDIPPEIEQVEAIAGAEISLPQPVTDDTGQVIVDTPSPQQVTVDLPLTDEEVEQAFQLKMIFSVRWLAEWTDRLLKKAGGKFSYKPKKL
ncbi:hypothetical protein ACFL0Y_03140 [Patescibacteria group bacterium]